MSDPMETIIAAAIQLNGATMTQAEMERLFRAARQAPIRACLWPRGRTAA